MVSDPTTAYLFDIDGVLTDPVEKKVTEEGLYAQIIDRLKKDEPVGLISGRSNTFIKDRFVNKLIEKIDDKSILKGLVTVGEKGGTWMTFDESGVVYEGKANGLEIPEDLKEKVRKIVEDKYKDSMFFDETKETMMTVEMQDGHNLDDFHRVREGFLEDLQQLLDDHNYKIDPTNIATDIEDSNLGKAFATQRFSQFIRNKDIKPSKFITFGDSRSDFEMADELKRRGKKVEMIYVGDREKLGDIKKNYPVEYVGGFSYGTLEYLKKQNQGI